MSNETSLYELRSLAKEDKLPIQVVVRRFGQFTGLLFNTLSDARQSYPTLDPENDNDKFTCGTRGLVEVKIENGVEEKEALRFEDWASYNAFSV
jgi:hypothetical protein